MVKDPFGLYLLWTLLLLLFCILGIPLISAGHSGGEQMPFTLFGYVCDAFVLGFIFISAISPFLYRKWYKKYLYIPLIVPLLIILLLCWLIINTYISNEHSFPW